MTMKIYCKIFRFFKGFRAVWMCVHNHIYLFIIIHAIFIHNLRLEQIIANTTQRISTTSPHVRLQSSLRQNLNIINEVVCSLWPSVKGTLNTNKSPSESCTQKNLIKSTRNRIVFTILRLIWIQTDVRSDSNLSENGKYSLILGWFNKISRKILCVCVVT